MTQRVTRWALVVWLLALLSYAVAITNRNSFTALGPTAQEHFSVDATMLGFFAVMQLILYTSMQIPVGILVQRFGPTQIILAGAMLMTAGQALVAVADQVWVAVLARALVGIGDAGTFVSVLRLLASWFPIRQLPIWTQLTSQLGQIGQIVAVIPLALFVANNGWMAGFLTVASVTFLIAALSFGLISDAPGDRTLLMRVIRPAAPTAETKKQSLGAEVWQQLRGIPALWRIPGVRLGYWVHFSTAFSGGMFVILWGYPFLIGGVGLSRAEAAGLITLTAILSMCFGIAFGPIMVRFYAHRVTMAITVVVAIIAAWALVLAWPGTPPTWTLVVLMVAIAAGLPMSMTGFDILRSYAPVHNINVATGLVNTGSFTATILAVFFIGVALDVQGAGTPATYSLDAFKVAMSTQFAILLLGLWQIIRNLRIVNRSLQA